MDFDIATKHDDFKNDWLIDLRGEVDLFNSGELKSKLLELISQSESNLVIDCKKLDYIDSTALGVLVSVLKNVKSYGGDMKLINVKPNIIKLFKITSLDTVFKIEGDSDE